MNRDELQKVLVALDKCCEITNHNYTVIEDSVDDWLDEIVTDGNSLEDTLDDIIEIISDWASTYSATYNSFICQQEDNEDIAFEIEFEEYKCMQVDVTTTTTSLAATTTTTINPRQVDWVISFEDYKCAQDYDPNVPDPELPIAFSAEYYSFQCQQENNPLITTTTTTSSGTTTTTTTVTPGLIQWIGYYNYHLCEQVENPDVTTTTTTAGAVIETVDFDIEFKDYKCMQTDVTTTTTTPAVTTTTTTAALTTTTTTTNLPCNTAITGANVFPATYAINIGSHTGEVTLTINTVEVPDKFIVEIDGIVVLNTGYRGDAGFQTVLYEALALQGAAPELIAGAAAGTFSFAKTSVTSIAVVKVYAPIIESKWSFSLSCVKQVTTSTTTMGEAWSGTYDNFVCEQQGNCIEYGALYNWYAATDARGISSSDDFSIPEWTDIETLLNYIDDFSIEEQAWLAAGNILRNSTFNLKYAGYRRFGEGDIETDGIFDGIDIFSMLGSATEYEGYSGLYYRHLFSLNFLNSIEKSGNPISSGVSFRLFRPATESELLLEDWTFCTPYIGNNLIQYKTVKIGTQVWLAEPLNETKYRNGDWITGFDGGVYTPISNAAWAVLTTEAMCYYDDNVLNGGCIDAPVTTTTTTTTVEVPVEVITCGETWHTGGEAYPYLYIVIGLGTGVGWVDFSIFTIDIPEKFIVEFNGLEVINTGYVGNPSLQSELNAALAAHGDSPEAIVPTPESNHYYFYKTGSTQNAIVKVFAPMPESQWEFRLRCPDGATTTTTTRPVTTTTTTAAVTTTTTAAITTTTTNAPPVSGTNTLTNTRETCTQTVTLVPANFTFTDANGDSLEYVKIVSYSLSGAGTLKYNGVVVTNNQVIQVYGGATGSFLYSLIYTPDGSLQDAYSDTITYQVRTSNNANYG